jgi:hypothetical protein
MWTLILLAVLLLAVPGFAQSEEENGPAEYQEEEFSPFLRNLRRAEIVMLGSFPITLFLTLEVFDIYRYIDNLGEPDAYRYTPWPLRSPEAAPYSAGQITGILVSAVSASVLIALADYLVGRSKEKRSER